MKTCPHCETRLKEGQTICPKCGKPYWQPDSPPLPDGEPGDFKEEETGCLPVLFWPLIISLCVTALLILTGFIFQLVTRFQSTQIKTIWVLGSCLAGGLVYLIIVQLRKKNS